MSLLRAIHEHFVTPPEHPQRAAREDFVAPDEVPGRACAEPAPRTPPGIAALAASAEPAPRTPPGAAVLATPAEPAPRTPHRVAVSSTPPADPASRAARGAATTAERAPRTPSGIDGIAAFAVPAEPAPRTPPGAAAFAVPAEPAPRTPPGVAVLASPADAQPLGAALGLALAARRRAPVVVLCVWTPDRRAAPSLRGPAMPAARRLAATLVARGHDARPAGRLTVVRLPSMPEEAVVHARRVTAAAGAAPTVLAFGGPRLAAFDELLAEQDLVVVATPYGTDPALARLALADLAAATTRACACEVPPAHPARSLAAAGLTLLPSARRALAVPVEALR